MELTYRSQVSHANGKILIEIGLREELLQPISLLTAKTLLRDPYSNLCKVNAINIHGLSLHEAYAEKIRAALCRGKIAIRDYYDLDYAIQNNLITFDDKHFISLIKNKVKNEDYFHDLSSDATISKLKSKIDTELVPTLKQSAAREFNLERIIQRLTNTTSSIFRTCYYTWAGKRLCIIISICNIINGRN